MCVSFSFGLLLMTNRKNILITGGTGFIGGHLSRYLVDQGYAVTVLTRAEAIHQTGTEHLAFVAALADLQPSHWYGVINLAGEPLNKTRWSQAQKAQIINSRVAVTQDLTAWLRGLSTPPEVFISGSAVGWYGHWDDECLDEDSPSRAGFSNALCAAWETAAMAQADLARRLCIVRLGIVLGNDGGSLPAMLLPAKLGLGGSMGNGRQWWSWIHLEDVVRSIKMLLENPQATGVFNLTAPHPVTQIEFAHTLGRQLHRPALLPLPGFMAKLMLGEFAEEVLLKGQRVRPKKLLDNGFTFNHPDLPTALRHLL